MSFFRDEILTREKKKHQNNNKQLPSPLTVPNVFYALALLRLPVLYLGIFFVSAVEKVTELAVSLNRLDTFLALPEPPPPAHLRVRAEGDDEQDVAEDVAVAFRGADFDWGGRKRGTKSNAAEEPLEGSSRFSFESASSGGGGGATGATATRCVSGPTLKAITLHVKRGELLGIAGPVGSGKSSLLLALLSELLPCPVATKGAEEREGNGGVGGQVENAKTKNNNTGLPPVVRGSLAYCSQVPWISPGTVRDAILFGSPFDRERYDRAVDAAALLPDLETLPAGDLTEIGERGVNLSGGQRARVALARAAYADADVVLLDDPLSALDARVGAAVFERCVANSTASESNAEASSSSSPSPAPSTSMMSGKTRLLVTHARHYLPRCDRVAVIRNGEVAALGTPTELAAQGVPELVGALKEAASSASGAVDVDAAADEAAADDEDEQGAGAAVAAITSNDLDAAGEVSEWDASNPQTPTAPLSVAGSDVAVATSAADDASVCADDASSSVALRSSAASRLSRAISNNLMGGDVAREGGGGGGGGCGGSGSGGSTTLGRSFGSLRAAVSRRFSRGGGGGNDPALATVSDAAPAAAPASKEDDDSGGPDAARLALGALVKAEGRAEGGVGGRVYASCAARLGGPACALVAVGLFAGQGAYLFAEYWVSILSPSSASASASASAASREAPQQDVLMTEIAGRAVPQS